MRPYKPKVKVPNPQVLHEMQSILHKNKLNVICEAAICPNRAECYGRKSATFMILGKFCTRACTFCNVQTGKGEPVDMDEPEHLSEAITELGLKYVVITSVDRDDLKDGGSGHFSACVRAIKKKNLAIKVELLTPDFKYNQEALDSIIKSGADKLAHNQETVRRLSKSVRPQSDYDRSLKVLEYYALHSQVPIKSSLMVGLGESEIELRESMLDLLNVGVSELTIGQYLQASSNYHAVEKYYNETFFEHIKTEAYSMGFEAVASGILVRSSYFAEKLGI